VRRLIGESCSEDEIVQEVFLALWLSRQRIANVEHLRPFLFRVARNICYDELRAIGRFQVVSLDAPPETPPGESGLPFLVKDRRPWPDEQVHWALVYSEVQRAMERLPEPQRQALILFAEEGLTYEQIAEAMGSDIGTVKSRIYYARKNLAKMLSPDTLEALGARKDKRS
jgi:RNA polymerase sigma-70 factor (ECF subfamily)